MDSITIKNTEKIEFHFVLDDKSHAMDAKVLHACNNEILDIVNWLSGKMEIPVVIETYALGEGGLKQVWKFIGDNGQQISVLISIITLVIMLLPQKPKMTALEEEHLLLENQKLELEIKELKNKNEGDELKPKDIEAIQSSHEISSSKSKYYEKLMSYPKVSNIEFSLKNNDDIIQDVFNVEYDNFVNYINDEESISDIVDESASISLICPVLVDKKYKWKGLYNNNIIDFYMNDEKFKDDIAIGNITFQAGTILNCRLITRRKMDQFKIIKITSYAVEDVGEIKNTNGNILTTRGKVRQAKERNKKNQFLLGLDEQE